MAEGGCLCGAVRFSVEGPPVLAELCHCAMCRRAAGAPVVAWGTWPRERFRWTAGQPAVYASSGKATRSFCGACGTPILFELVEVPGTVDVTLVSLDEPTLFPPTAHIWTMSRLPWLHLDDRLTQHDGGSAPDG